LAVKDLDLLILYPCNDRWVLPKSCSWVFYQSERANTLRNWLHSDDERSMQIAGLTASVPVDLLDRCLTLWAVTLTVDFKQVAADPGMMTYKHVLPLAVHPKPLCSMTCLRHDTHMTAAKAGIYIPGWYAKQEAISLRQLEGIQYRNVGWLRCCTHLLQNLLWKRLRNL
jgi:hypothetical protein